MKTAIYHYVEVEVIELFGYYASIRYKDRRSCIVPRDELIFQGGN